VFVKTLTGKTVNCDVVLDWDVLTLKRTIQEKEGIPPDQPRLIFGGKQLENRPTLSSYGIQRNDATHLVFRWRVGGA
ncbi:ubiquitin, partial [Lactarius indigo]